MPETAGDVADKGTGEVEDLAGDAAGVHQLTHQHEEGDSQHRVGGDAAHHGRGEQGKGHRPATAKEDIAESGKNHGEPDRYPDKDHEEESENQPHSLSSPFTLSRMSANNWSIRKNKVQAMPAGKAIYWTPALIGSTIIGTIILRIASA